MLEVRDLTVLYDQAPAVVQASLNLPTGQVLAVLGPSGCGKSTLLRAVAGLEPPASGTLSWDGRDLSGVPTHKRGFALMFQDGQLFNHLTVARNIAYPLRIRRRPRSAQRVAELLALVGLDGFADRLPATLSGGERQRVALARSLAADPRLLLLDEPLSALDAGLRERLAADLRVIVRAAGTTALFVTHDHEEAFAVADRIAVMRAGRIVQHGDLDAVWRAPVDAETALFLGYSRVLEGQAAARVWAAGGSSRRSAHDTPGSPSRTSGTIPPGEVAVRRSALRLDPTGPLTGRVISARVTPLQVRVVVSIDGVGEIDAVAPLDQHPGVGETVRLAADHTRMAVIAAALGPGSL